MIKCKKCSLENENSSKYCKNCGELLEDRGLTNILFDSMPLKKSSNFFSSERIKIVSGVIALVFIVMIGFYLLSSDPTTKVMTGFYHFFNDDTKEMTCQVNFSDYSGMGSDIIENFNFNLYLAKNKEQTGGALEITYDEQLLYYPKFETKEDKFYFDILEDKIYYYEDDLIEESLVSSNALAEYIKDIEIDSIDSKKYMDIIKDELDDSIYEEDGKVVLELDLEQVIVILGELVDELKDDDPVIEEFHGELIVMLNQMLEDDFEFYIDGETFDEDIIEEALDELEDYDDFEDEFTEYLEDIQEDIDYELDYTSDILERMEVTVTFDFTLTNKINEMIIEFDGFDDIGDFTIALDLTNGYKFNDYDEEESDEYDPEDYEEIRALEEDLLDLLSDRVRENEELNDDMESYGIENVDDLIYELMWLF